MGAARAIWSLRVVLKPVLLLAAIILSISYVFFPWAMPIPGRETLTGSWSGPITASHGPEAWMLMTVEVKPSLAQPWTYIWRGDQFNSPAGAPLVGRAVVCTRRLGRIEFTMNGRTTAWSGETLKVLITPKSVTRPELRLDMAGKWTGTTIALIQPGNNLDEVLGEPGLGGNNQRDWIRAVLQKDKGAEWSVNCARIQGLS